MIPDYRAYAIDEKQQTRQVFHLASTSDAEALTEARRLSDGRPVEVWDGPRLVGSTWPNHSGDKIIVKE